MKICNHLIDGFHEECENEAEYLIEIAITSSTEICSDHLEEKIATFKWEAINAIKVIRIEQSSEKKIYQHFKLNPKQRQRIFKRDGFCCLECDEKALAIPPKYDGRFTLYTQNSFLVLDHINPQSKGGSSDDLNLRTLCQTCNARKGNR